MDYFDGITARTEGDADDRYATRGLYSPSPVPRLRAYNAFQVLDMKSCGANVSARSSALLCHIYSMTPTAAPSTCHFKPWEQSVCVCSPLCSLSIDPGSCVALPCLGVGDLHAIYDIPSNARHVVVYKLGYEPPDNEVQLDPQVT